MAAPSAPAPSWDFCLPVSPADLLRGSGASSQYVVQKVLPLQQLSGRLSEFQTTFRAQGALAILHHFDTPYSILHHLRAVDSAIKEDALELMIKVVASHSSALTSVLNDADLVPSIPAHLNALKMNCYLLVRLVEAFETESGESNLVGLDARRKSKKKQTIGFVWEEERRTVLQVLTQLLQLDLHRLWNGLAVEEEFVSLVTSCSYRILQNPSIGHQKYRPTREAAIHLLGIALQRYDHMLSATLKVTQMLQYFEHAPPVFIEAVSVWLKEYGMKSIVGELLREIGQKCPNDLARDASGMKGYAAFLAELAEQTPAVVLANMSVLMHHLDGESYGMRNAILTAMAEVLLQVLNGEQLEESARSTRDQFLDTLQAHTCDVHGFVRSRVLQLFTRIVQQKVLPLTRFQAVVSLGVSRLQDKSVTVVKNAIQLLAAFLSNNPFFCKLSCTEITDLLAKERQKLQEMKKCSTPAAVVISPEEEWEAMQPEIQATLKTCLSSQEQEEELDQFEMEDSAQLSNSIVQLLRISNYKGAIRLMQEGMRHFQEVESFATPRGEGDGEDFILSTLRTFYLGSQTKNVVQGSTEDTNHGGTEEQVPVLEEEQAAPEIVKQEMLIQYLQDAHNFSAKITEALSMVSKLMYECSVSVVQEAIEFFVVVSQFSIPQAILGVRQMLPLIWSKEPGIREAVLDAYRRLYLNPSGETERARAQNLVHSLSLLMVDASLATIKCLGEIVSEFVQKDEIKPAVVQLLWEQFTEKSQCSVLERHAAIMLLGMMASGNPEIVGSNLDVLVNVGLDERAHEDYHLAQEVCHAISKIGNSQKPSLGKDSAPFRLPQSHMLFDRLHEAVTVGFGRSSAYWIPFAETAVALIYQLAEGPEELCAQILQSCSQRALKKLQESERTEAEPGSSPKSAGDDSGTMDTVVLTHLVSLAGNVALQQLVHLELSVSNELRRRRILGEEQEAKEQAASKTKAQKGKSTGNEVTMEEELGLVGASAEDTEAELIRTICETELLDGKQLLSAFFPLVLNFCNSPGLCSDPALAAAAALALGKYCMISAEFCDTHLRLFFTMMEKSTHSSVRANLMIAAGDLAIRFPNQVEPWTSHLYTRLRDPCPYVRQTAALVMSHLILKDMVKVKGQVSEMATLLIDPEEEIAGLARNFFTELSSKDNAVYNLLPDIISRLSDPDSGIEELPFHTIMRQLFSFITKDKQTESLVEKLCQRFRTARTERQHHDLAYCLTLLPLTDRSIHKMQNNFDCFADKLQDTTVYNYFLAALGRFRRVGRKPEMKALTDEFEQRLRMCHSKGLDSFNDNPEDSISQEGKNTPAAQTAKKRATNSRRRPLRASNADSSFITPTPRLSRSRRKATQRRMTVVFSSDEENDSEEELYAELREEETPLKTTPISRTSSRRAR